ncbi:hypothetical protein R1flu_016278 [Riccia fluitans]|uniref:Exocyst component Exo84 C-terminal domain-containing protein n=1 Tax=Riccia fluitans TaxID=41844 RepID=A0ABD1YLE4_9MARC
MSTLKPSVRVRGVSGPLLANGAPTYNGHLRDELRVFESHDFDANGYVQGKCQSMSEKAIRQLCAELQDLKKASAEEMRKSVYANYTAFIRTSKEISDLEGELVSMRNLLSTQAALIHGLAEGTSLATVRAAVESPEEDSYLRYDTPPSDLERHAQALPDILDVLLAERKVPQALAALDDGERLIAEAQRVEENKGNLFTAPLQAALSERRSRLAEQLAEAARQPSVRGSELRNAIAALEKLGDGPRAHSLLLKSHHERLQHNIRTLRPSGTSYGGAYTAALSQLVFSAIAQAARDSVGVFGDGSAYASELVLWARLETENFASLVERHVLSSSAAAGGLRSAAECVQIAIGHCALLEDQGLALSSLLTKLVRPSVEQALEANLKRIEESVTVLSAADDWVLTSFPATQPRTQGRASAPVGYNISLRLSSSAHRFNSMVQDFLEDVSPLISMQLAGHALDGLAHIFDTYIELLMKALPVLAEDDEEEKANVNKVQHAENINQQLVILGNAAALADELLPRAASKLIPSSAMKEEFRGSSRRLMERQTVVVAARLPELRDWRRRLQRGVERLRDHFCLYHVFDVVYNADETEDIRLSPETYLTLDLEVDDYVWLQEPMPTRTFQAFYFKLNNISQVASELLAGRERMVSLLLMRLSETFVNCIRTADDFWDVIEDGGERALGPVGLKQFLLDLQFVMQVAAHGRYAARTMRQVVNELSQRAANAFYATGQDPGQFLPEDNWFVETAKDGLRKLLSEPGVGRCGTGPEKTSYSLDFSIIDFLFWSVGSPSTLNA